MADNDNGLELAAILAAFDYVESLEVAAGFDDGHRLARRQLVQGLANALLAVCRTPVQRSETVKALVSACRVRQPQPAVLPMEQIVKFESAFHLYHYRGVELDMIAARMKPNEFIVQILPCEVVTDRQTITRKSFRDARPVTFSNQDKWDVQFPSDEELADRQAQYDADQKQAERRREQSIQAERQAEVAQQQAAAARQRAIEAQEDALLGIVERAQARQANKE